MQALVHLAGGLPERKWHTAIAPITGELPIVPLLGGMLSSSPIFYRAITTKHAERQSGSEHSTLCMLNGCSIMRHWLYMVGTPEHSAFSYTIDVVSCGIWLKTTSFLQGTSWQVRVKLEQQWIANDDQEALRMCCGWYVI